MAFLRKLPAFVVMVPMLACTFNAGGLGQTGADESVGTGGSSGSSSGGASTGGPTSEPLTTESPTSMGPAGEASATGSTAPVDPDTTTTTVDPSATTDEPMTATTVEPSTSSSGDSSSGGETTTGCVEQEFFKDMDKDGFGDPKLSKMACEPPKDYVTQAGDCDDKKAEINPDADEVCDNTDNDCDDAVDEFAPDSNIVCGGCNMVLYPVNNRVYYFCAAPVKSWAASQVDCEKRGGFLAKDIDKAHHEWMVMQLPDNSGPWWIGATSPKGDSKFTWLDGSPVPYDDRWGLGRPILLGDDRILLVSNNNQVFPWENNDGRWYDREDKDNQPYICESEYKP